MTVLFLLLKIVPLISSIVFVVKLVSCCCDSLFLRYNAHIFLPCIMIGSFYSLVNNEFFKAENLEFFNTFGIMVFFLIVEVLLLMLLVIPLRIRISVNQSVMKIMERYHKISKSCLDEQLKNILYEKNIRYLEDCYLYIIRSIYMYEFSDEVEGKILDYLYENEIRIPCTSDFEFYFEKTYYGLKYTDNIDAMIKIGSLWKL